jgi:ABC-type glutathione transport system ATPase component
MKQILRLENINKTYQAKNGEIEALKDINFSVEEGEFVSIIGPSRMWKIYTSFNNCRIRRKESRQDLYRWY